MRGDLGADRQVARDLGGRGLAGEVRRRGVGADRAAVVLHAHAPRGLAQVAGAEARLDLPRHGDEEEQHGLDVHRVGHDRDERQRHRGQRDRLGEAGGVAAGHLERDARGHRVRQVHLRRAAEPEVDLEGIEEDVAVEQDGVVQRRGVPVVVVERVVLEGEAPAAVAARGDGHPGRGLEGAGRDDAGVDGEGLEGRRLEGERQEEAEGGHGWGRAEGGREGLSNIKGGRRAAPAGPCRPWDGAPKASKNKGLGWCAQRDSNPWPVAPEATALSS